MYMYLVLNHAMQVHVAGLSKDYVVYIAGASGFWFLAHLWWPAILLLNTYPAKLVRSSVGRESIMLVY